MIRIIKILPEHVMKYWEYVEEALKNSLPPHIADNPKGMMRIQEHLFGGVMQCWAIIDANDLRTVGLIVTRILHDDIGECNNLLIFSLYGFEAWDFRVWNKIFQILRKFAESRGCQNAVAYTNDEASIEIAKRYGGSAEYTFVKIPV